MADARSILALLLLCGAVGMVVHLEASGTDEEPAIAAMTSLFEAEDSDSPDGGQVAGQPEQPIS